MRALVAVVSLLATPALAQGGAPLQTIAPGTLLTCRANGVASGMQVVITGIGVYADQTGSRGGFVWDHRGFAFISGPYAGVPAEAAGGVLFLTPPGSGGQTLVCAPG